MPKKIQPKKLVSKTATLRILYIGDVMGKPGRKAVSALLPALRRKHAIDAVIANAENLAHGKGISPSTIEEMKKAGVDFFTSGNHIWAKAEGLPILSATDPIVLRPSNYPPGSPGRGEKVLALGKNRILVVNLMGRVFMKENLDCPFRTLDRILAEHQNEDLSAILVDFHAEATSEKNAFAHFADGRVSAVVGTHTHIPTADARVLPRGTAFTTDIGMVGLRDSSIGISVEPVIEAFLTQRGAKFDIPDTGLVVFNAVLIDIERKTRKARLIKRVQEEIHIQ